MELKTVTTVALWDIFSERNLEAVFAVPGNSRDNRGPSVLNIQPPVPSGRICPFPFFVFLPAQSYTPLKRHKVSVSNTVEVFCDHD
jgi:hypothetical protein